MPTFFFDFCQGSTLIEDDRGLVFETVEDAYLDAYEAALEMWSDLLRRRQDPRRYSFRVRGGDGALLFVLPFTEVLETCLDAKGRAPIMVTYNEVVRAALRARKLSADFGRELSVTREAIREATELIAAPIPGADKA